MPLPQISEVFGYNIKDFSEDAIRGKKLRLCPYYNRIPNCNRDRAKNPLGVCSIVENGKPVMVCQVRLRQSWKVITDIAEEFFPEDTTWTTVADVKLYDKLNKFIDTIDFVIVAYDKKGNVIDFISLDNLEIHVLGNLRQEFNAYVDNPKNYLSRNHGTPDISLDYVKSVHKRITPQIIYKSSIFNAWGKKTIYALDINLFYHLPEFIEVQKQKAEISWFAYELQLDPMSNNFKLQLIKISHTLFQPTLFEMTKVEPGPLEEFISLLQQKLEEKLEYDYIRDNIFNDILE